jgi:hypothetical protein
MLGGLKALFSKSAPTSSNALGSDADPIRRMLFASQSLREQVSRMGLSGQPGPMQSIADAQKLLEEGKTKEAATLLRQILDGPAPETRLQLWVWCALRELGEKPDGRSAFEVLGAVLEMPSGGLYDTLAGYVDGSARYLNFSGKAIFWDVADPTIKALCRGLIDSVIPASRHARPRTSLSIPKRGIQVTMLTRSGPFVIVDPPQEVIGAGKALMLELIRRAREKESETTRSDAPRSRAP